MVNEIYVSIDIETNGPIPGMYSMLSLGAVAFNKCGEEIASISANLLPLMGASEDPETMKWWSTQPDAWVACSTNQQKPRLVMEGFSRLLDSLPGFPVFVAYPVAFDIMFLYWYLQKFVGKTPVGFRAIDIRSFIMGKFGRHYHKSHKGDLPAYLRPPKGEHTHVAVEDAREQGKWFMLLMSTSPTIQA